MDKNKQERLFGEFPPISTEAWEEKIHEDLKGADYDKKLIWRTVEGLRIKPYYRSEDLQNLSHVKALPNEAPFVRGNKEKYNEWDVRQDFEETDPEKANKMVLDAFEKGADAVGLNMEKVTDVASLKKLLKNTDPARQKLHFLHAKNYVPVLADFIQLAGENQWDKQKIQGSLNFDPLGYYVLYERFYQSSEENFKDAVELLEKAKKELPALDVITVNGQHFHNAGAHIIQELAFTLSQGNEYLAQLTAKGIPADDIAPRMQFVLAVGSSYFMEIAKIRAIRMLWAKIVEQYKVKDEKSLKMTLHAETSGWNKTVFDPYVNMLRTTTEGMAAAIAGADSIAILPFDQTYKKGDAFSQRIARNQQIVLKHESYFSKVADPSAGSYYIENITDAIAGAAWDLFVETEEKGGFIKAVEQGFIRSAIEQTCQARDMDIALRKQTFVGVNQYPNLQERMLDKMQPTARPTDIAALRSYRGAQAFEALRMSMENHEKKGFEIPLVYLFTYGNLTMRKARASFATNFFGCAGYTIQEAPMIKSLDEGMAKALETNAQIVVFCSADDEYADMIPAAQKILATKPETQIVVAGNPKEAIGSLREAGIQHFIHMRSNALETLQRFNDLFAIA